MEGNIMAERKRQKAAAGVLPNDKIGAAPKRVKKSVIERFMKLNDLSSTVSDILDNMGIIGCVGTSTLHPTISTARIVGTAITVRNVPQRKDSHVVATDKRNFMAEIEGINQADPGDVLVIQGLRDISNMGGIMATCAKRQELAGAVVDGGVRDVGHSRSLDFPIWSKDVSPITGKWRCVTEEINGKVTIHGISVQPGDLVIADETGVCFVPQNLIEDVLEKCEAIHNQEGGWVENLDKGLSIPDIVKKIYAKK
jgi:4-hydroxy-4-methyl-2-oxoglutarate aldolase